MATNTYVALATTTLSSSASSIDFTSISGAYTDLVIVGNMYATSNDVGAYIQFNGDTGTNYSSTFMFGNGSTAGSARYSNQTSMNVAGYNYGIGSTNSIYSPIQVNIQNYSNTTTNKTVLARSWVQNNAGSRELYAYAGLWRSTAAITSIKFILNTGSWAAGSTFTLYGVAAEGQGYATGGIVTSDANYYYHAFTSSGTFTPSKALTADILVVAGGGSGTGGDYSGGGGGAGGLLAFTAQSLASGTGYTCTIGAGGPGVAFHTLSNNGSNSQFGSLTASVGGGGGGGNAGAAGAWNGKNGGSGGGGAADDTSGGGITYGGTATSGQGNNGGGNGNYQAPSYPAGGGGGAGGVGGNGTTALAGAGGAGTNAYSSWLSATGLGISGYIAGGGGGAVYTTGGGGVGGPGGTGGGGQGGGGSGGSNGANAVANTGSGGGGGGAGSSAGGGGSGLIIVRYPK